MLRRAGWRTGVMCLEVVVWTTVCIEYFFRDEAMAKVAASRA